MTRTTVKQLRTTAEASAPQVSQLAGTPPEPDGEHCQSCGRAYPLGGWWHAPDDLWLRVTGQEEGLRCPDCFGREANAKGITLVWSAAEYLAGTPPEPEGCAVFGCTEPLDLCATHAREGHVREAGTPPEPGLREAARDRELASPADGAGLDVERLAVAMNTAQIDPAEIRLGRDLRVPAARIIAALAAPLPKETP